MKKSFDYLIIGGGPVGCSIAYHMALKGLSNIAVIERDVSYRSCSALLSAGGIRQQFSLPENIKMSMYGAEFLKNMKTALTIPDEPDFLPDPQFQQNGYLFLSKEQTKHILLNNLKTQHECGATWIKQLEKADLREDFPWLHTQDLVLGTFGTQNEGYFDPWLLITALRKKAASMGVLFIDGEVVGGKLVPASGMSSSYCLNHIVVKPSQNQSQAGNILKEEKLTGGTVINAAGAWSGRILDLFAKSLPDVISGSLFPLPVAPRKRNIFCIHCRPSETMDSHGRDTIELRSATGHFIPPSNGPLVVDPSGVYFRPEVGRVGHFITGVSPPEHEDGDIPPQDENDAIKTTDEKLFFEAIWPVLADRVPAFQEIKMTASWAGYYDYNRFDQVSFNKSLQFPAIRSMIRQNIVWYYRMES